MSDLNALDHSHWVRASSYPRKWSKGTEVIPGRSVPLTGRVGDPGDWTENPENVEQPKDHGNHHDNAENRLNGLAMTMQVSAS